MQEENIVIDNRVLIRVLSLLILLVNMLVVDAQQLKIGKNISNLKPNVVLELEDTAQALLLTRVFNPSSIIGANSYRGMLVYDSSVNKLAYYDGSNWIYPISNVADTSIYKYDGSLSSNRRVNLNSKTLSFFNGSDSLYLSGGKVGISVNPISALHVSGAVRADSLALLSNKLYKPFNTSLDSVAIIDSVGRLMKVGVSDILNATTSANNFDWTLSGYSSSSPWISKDIVVSGKQALYATTSATGYMWNATFYLTMTNYMYAKDTISVKYDAFAQAFSGRTGSYYLQLLEYSDLAGNLVQTDTLKMFLQSNTVGNSADLASGINTGWNNNLVTNIKLQPSTRYVKLQFVIVNKGTATAVTAAFSNVSISTPTVNTNSLNYVQGGNSFGTLGVLGLQDNKNLSIITNNTNRIFVDTLGRVGIGTSTPKAKLSIGEAGSFVSGATPDVLSLGKTYSNAAGKNLKLKLIDNGIDTSTLWGFGVSANQLDYVAAASHVFFTSTGVGVSPTEKMRISRDGNVGIGTSSPAEKLDIKGNLTFSASDTTYSYMIYPQKTTANVRGSSLTISGGQAYNTGSNAQKGGNVLIQGGDGYATNNPVPGQVYIYGGQTRGIANTIVNTQRGNVILAHDGTTASGNVGIGTINPIGMLQVKGAIRTDSLLLVNLPPSFTKLQGLGIDSLGNVSIMNNVTPTDLFMQGGVNSGGNAFGDTARLGTYDNNPLRLYVANLPSITAKPINIALAGYVPMDSNMVYLRNIAYDANSKVTLHTTGSNNTLTSGQLSDVIDNDPSTGIVITDANAGNLQAFNIQLNDFYYIDSVVLISKQGPTTNTGSTNNSGLSFAHVQLFNGSTSVQDYNLNQPSYTANQPYGVKMNGGLSNIVRIYQNSQTRLYRFLISEVYIYGRRSKAIYSGTTETRVNGALAIDGVSAGSLSIDATGKVYNASDSTLKISAGFLGDNTIQKIMLLKPRYYYWNGKNNMPANVKELGFYAQEINSVLGNEVAPKPVGTAKYYGINDRGLIAYMVKAMQEQQKQIEENVKQIADQQKQIDELKVMLQQLLKK